MINRDPEVIRKMVHDQVGMSSKETKQYQVYDDEVYERRVVHRFRLGDSEDPEIYVAFPISEWQETEHGKWVMEHGRNQQYHMNLDPVTYGHVVIITAHITPKRWTEYILRGWFTG